MEEKKQSTPKPACVLGKSRANCQTHSTAECVKCGWNPDEQVRRRALPLVKGADGLYHKDIRPEA